MLALLLKDVLTVRKTIFAYLLFAVFYVTISVYAQYYAPLLVFVLIISISLPLSAFMADEACHWPRYATCLPISHTTLVTSRYFLGILGTLITALPALLIGLFTKDNFLLVSSLFMIATSLFMLSIQLPLIFVFGAQRGRFLSAALVLLIGFGIPFLVMRADFISTGKQRLVDHLITSMTSKVEQNILLLILLPIIACLISAFLSIRLTRRREVT